MSDTLHSFALNKVVAALNKIDSESNSHYDAFDFSIMMGIIFDKNSEVILIDIVNKGIGQ